MRGKKIEGSNVYLAPLEVSDAETISKWLSEETLSRGFNTSFQYISEFYEKNELEKICNNDNNGYFAVIRKQDDKLIGVYNLQTTFNKDRFSTIGGYIGDINERNKGFGTEALKLVCDFAFNVIGYHTLSVKIFSFNHASIISAEKIGFKKIGELKERCYYNGKFYSEYIFQLIDRDFNKLWKTNLKPLNRRINK